MINLIKLLGYPHLWKLRMLEYSLIMSSVYSNDNGTSRTCGETRKASGANVWIRHQSIVLQTIGSDSTEVDNKKIRPPSDCRRTAENRADRELLELLLLLQQCMKEAPVATVQQLSSNCPVAPAPQVTGWTHGWKSHLPALETFSTGRASCHVLPSSVSLEFPSFWDVFSIRIIRTVKYMCFFHF